MMTAPQLISDLFEHMQWADAVVWKAVVASPAAAADSNVRDRLLHIHMTQQAFLHVWQDKPFDYQAASFPELAGLLGWAREYYATAGKFLAALDDSAWRRPVILPWANRFTEKWGRDAAAPTFEQTALQVAMHSTYHRGQVNARLRQLGSEPPLTDFIVWLWLDRPTPTWPT